MPSQNYENNMIIMEPTKTPSRLASEMSSSAVSSLASSSATEEYFSFSATQQYFPTLHAEEDYVPLGNPKQYCLHLDWIRKDYRKMTDKYFHVQEFPQCSLAANPKGIWYKTDPTNGLDFLVWRQTAVESSAYNCDDNGFFVGRSDGTGKCLHYEYLDGLCLLIKYVEHPESASFSWDFVEGCFEGGKIAHYSPAVAG